MGLLRTDRNLPETDIHDILRNDRRRNVIKQLQETNHEVSLRDLSVRVAEIETGESPPPSNIRDSVYISLHQTHLPKLDDADIVDYDSDRKTISLQKPAQQVDLYMEVVTKYGITWAAYYRTLGTLSLITVLFAAMQLPVVSSIDVLLWASFFLAVIAGSTVYQLWSRRWLYLQQLF
ncbi:DUF7344 domain-containing protein [Salinirarus marinus]|uniref:DUF7344 domain-containing protein n=2 Tax=Haloferacaceae TaxID=1644056 RepID=UPI003C6BFEFF